jgi:hypothetical protein
MNTKNLVGQKHHHLTFVRKTDQKLRDRFLWEVRCDCGSIIYRHAIDLTQGRVKSCQDKTCPYRRALMNRVAVNKVDYTGQRYHRLIFIQPTESRSLNGSVRWEAICDCGKTVCVIPHNGKSCGCLGEETRVVGGKKNRKYDPKISNARHVWHRYRDGGIDFDTFYHLSQQPCNYCGRMPYRASNYSSNQYGTFTYNGLDRIDSTKGHTLDNVVPCCADCNWMKGDRTQEEFLLHIGRIYSHVGHSSQLSYPHPPPISGSVGIPPAGMGLEGMVGGGWM